MISSVDTKAKTFTIAGKAKSRTFKLSEYSVITKAGAPATAKDLTEKQEVRGNYWKEGDALFARTIKVGPLTPEEKAASDTRKAKRAARKAKKAAKADSDDSASPAPSASASPAATATPSASAKPSASPKK